MMTVSLIVTLYYCHLTVSKGCSEGGVTVWGNACKCVFIFVCLCVQVVQNTEQPWGTRCSSGYSLSCGAPATAATMLGCRRSSQKSVEQLHQTNPPSWGCMTSFRRQGMPRTH